jgi:hypothetical protein
VPTVALDVVGDITSSATISGSTVSATTLTGTLSTAAQTNITSVGTLSSLDVGGDINVSNTSGAYLSIDTDSAAANAGIRLSESSTPTTNGAELVYDGATNKFHIKTGAASFTERLTIERDSGNVGIGTASPASLLHLVEDSGQARLLIESPSGQNSFVGFRIQGERSLLFLLDIMLLIQLVFSTMILRIQKNAHRRKW